MSGDYETLEMNQPKISYFKKRSENNTEWLDELINKIEDMKNKISKDQKAPILSKKLAPFSTSQSYTKSSLDI